MNHPDSLKGNGDDTEQPNEIRDYRSGLGFKQVAEIEYHRTEEDARKHAAILIHHDGAKMVAVMEIKSLYEATITAKEVA